LHDHLDVIHGQVDKHTGDLGSLVANELLDVLEEHGTHLLLVVGVLGHHSGQNLVAAHQIALLDRHVLLLGHLLLLLLLLLLLGLLLHLHHLLLGVHAHGLLALHLAVHGAVATHLVAVAAVIGAHGSATGLAALVAVVARVLLAAHRARLLLHEVRHGLEEHLKVVLDFLLVGEVGPLGALGVLLAEKLEIVLVLGGLSLDLTDLLDLVVVDSESLVIDGQIFFGRGCLVRLLEADESVELFLLTRGVHLERLNLSVLLEESAKLILSHGLGEALNVEVASLLGALILDSFAEAFGLAVGALECFFDIKLLVVWKGLPIDSGLAV